MPPKKSAKKPTPPLDALLSYVVDNPDEALLSVDSLTTNHLRASVGLIDPDGSPMASCSNKWANSSSKPPSTERKRKLISANDKNKANAADKSCSCHQSCLKCLNNLGQDKWESEDAWENFAKAQGLKEGPDVENRDPDIPVGLKNLGATCYANSLLQVWFLNETFRRGVYACQPPANGNVQDSPLFQLQVTFAALQEGSLAVFNPVDLVKALRLDQGEQQDAQEFSKLFMSLLEREFRKQDNPQIQSLFADQFEGKITYGTKCERCGTSSTRTNSFNELELNLKPNCHLDKQIREMLKSELLTDDNKYHCAQCDSKQDATRFTQIEELPPVLHFSLLRFVFDMDTLEREKSNSNIFYPSSIDMSEFLPNTGDSTAIYDLKGVLKHKGSSAHHGHYVARVWDNRNGKWFLFDDESVSEISQAKKKADLSDRKGKRTARSSDDDEKVIKYAKIDTKDTEEYKDKDAYMLVYIRRGTDADPRSPAPVVPPLAEDTVKQIDGVQDKAMTAHQAKEQELKKLFKSVRRSRQTVYRQWDVEDDQINGFFVPAQSLRDWILTPLQSPKPSEKTVTTPKSNGTSTEPMQIDGAESLPFTNGILLNGSITNGHSQEHTIDASSLLCPHQRLSPKMAIKAKLLNQDTVGILESLDCSITPKLSDEDVCRDCLWSEISTKLYSVKHCKALADYKRIKPKANPTGRHLISKEWLKEWSKLAGGLVRIPASLDDIPPDGADYRDHVKCKHNRLISDSTLRQVISTEEAEFFQTLFPLWTPATLRTDTCDECSDGIIEVEALTPEQRQEEKFDLKLMCGELRQGDGFGSIQPGTISILVPRKFFLALHNYLRKTVKPARPTAPAMDQYFCEHGLLIVDMNNKTESKMFMLVNSAEWDKLQKWYPFERKIVAEKESQDAPISTIPAFCENCAAAKRKQFVSANLTIAFISQEDIAADGILKTPPLTDLSKPIPTTVRQKQYGTTRSTRSTPTTSRNGDGKKSVRQPFRVEIEKNTDVKTLKMFVNDQYKVSPIYQQMYHKDRELENTETVESLGLSLDDTIYCLELKAHDDDVDITKLDATVKKTKRKSAGPERGFQGTGLAGFNSFSDVVTPPTNGESKAIDLKEEEERSAMAMQSLYVACPTCTFNNPPGNTNCEICDGEI